MNIIINAHPTSKNISFEKKNTFKCVLFILGTISSPAKCKSCLRKRPPCYDTPYKITICFFKSLSALGKPTAFRKWNADFLIEWPNLSVLYKNQSGALLI